MSAHATPGLWSRLRTKFRRTPIIPAPTRAQPVLTWEQEQAAAYDADLLRFLYAEAHRVTRLRASHWIMNEVWWADIRNMRDARGRTYVDRDVPGCNPRTVLLLGIPVRIHPWAGVPTVVPHA